MKPKLFLANLWATSFKHASNDGYVVSAGSNVLVKITLDNNGVLTIEMGKNPRGVIDNNADTRAYVLNYISKDVSVVDLTQTPDATIATIRSADLPAPGSDAAKFLLGNYLFNTSRGEFDEGVSERMSSEGWQSCARCHPDGLSDGVVWQFASGPRKSIPLNGAFSSANTDENQRILNYSAIIDELEDFNWYEHSSECARFRCRLCRCGC